MYVLSDTHVKCLYFLEWWEVPDYDMPEIRTSLPVAEVAGNLNFTYTCAT